MEEDQAQLSEEDVAPASSAIAAAEEADEEGALFKRPMSPTAHRKRPAPKESAKPAAGMRRLMAYKRMKVTALLEVSSSSAPSIPPPQQDEGPNVAYVYSSEATVAADLLPVSQGKVERTHALIAAYGLLKPSLVRLIAPEAATRQQLMEYHDSDYLDRLHDAKPQPKQRPEKRNIFDMKMGPSGKRSNRSDAGKKPGSKRPDSDSEDDSDSSSDSSKDSESDESEDDSSEEEPREGDEEFGLQHDCSPFPGVFQHAAMTAGSTLKACDELKTRRCSVAINWMGGRHHAKKDEAAGFCYINDIVLAILSLMSSYPKVLYIDLDIHHGDGVEEAFYYTDKVFCVSFHHYAPGFYPGTGRLNQIGAGKGKYHTVNVPLKAGIGDEAYVDLFRSIIPEVFSRFCPRAVVLQCGVDGLVGDPLGGFNLTMQSLGDCVGIVRDLCAGPNPGSCIPLLVLGGGGYHSTNAARAYAYLTSVLLRKELGNDIPEHRFFEDYKENGFQLRVVKGNVPDKNDQAYLDHVRRTILDNLARVTTPS